MFLSYLTIHSANIFHFVDFITYFHLARKWQYIEAERHNREDTNKTIEGKLDDGTEDGKRDKMPHGKLLLRGGCAADGSEPVKKLEIIHLRLAGNPPAALVEQIHASIAAEGCPIEVRIYRHATVTTDLAIHLLPSNGGTCASDLGLLLAEALREHGMVEHTVWIEERDDG
jgi:hypothetical protein